MPVSIVVFLTGFLGKRCKAIEWSFALVLPHTTHRFPGFLALSQLASEALQTLDCYAMSRGRPSTFFVFLQNYTNQYHVLAHEAQTSLAFPLNSILNAAERRFSGTPDVTSRSILRCNQHSLHAFVYSGRAYLPCIQYILNNAHAPLS